MFTLIHVDDVISDDIMQCKYNNIMYIVNYDTIYITLYALTFPPTVYFLITAPKKKKI